MIQIAICDDNVEELNKISGIVKQYMEEKYLEYRLCEFIDPNQLLLTGKKSVFQIYILDIVMPLVDGIELGKEIRSLDHEAQIIYATTEPQYALSAYQANPLNYLLKPIDREKLHETLSLAVGKISSIEEDIFSVKTGGGIQVVKCHQIVCCEYTNHCVWFTLITGEKVKSTTIAGKFVDYIEELLKKTQFLQPHTSFVMNMRYVERFDKGAFTLRGNVRVPISARSYHDVRDHYMDYLMEEGS